MSIFSWLLIGHCVGDLVLQNDWMAKGKRQGLFTTPGMVHFTIYTVTLLITLFISEMSEKGTLYVLGISALIFISHWIIDATDIVDTWMKFYRQSNISTVRLMVDQTFHLLVLAGVAIAA